MKKTYLAPHLQVLNINTTSLMATSIEIVKPGIGTNDYADVDYEGGGD